MTTCELVSGLGPPKLFMSVLDFSVVIVRERDGVVLKRQF